MASEENSRDNIVRVRSAAMHSISHSLQHASDIFDGPLHAQRLSRKMICT